MRLLALHHMFHEKLPHVPGDDIAVFFQGKMPGVKEVKLDGLQIPLVRMRAFGREVALEASNAHDIPWVMMCRGGLRSCGRTQWATMWSGSVAAAPIPPTD